MIELKPCPCGKTPDSLHIGAEHNKPKWSYVSGQCCSDWEAEFRSNYNAPDSPESMKLAIERWNELPRPDPLETVRAEIVTLKDQAYAGTFGRDIDVAVGCQIVCYAFNQALQIIDKAKGVRGE